MSRLQVGGLSLCLTTGNTCTLIEHFGNGYTIKGGIVYDAWLVEYDILVACESTGDLSKRLYESSKNLVPLGDKQTQDQFIEELELCQG